MKYFYEKNRELLDSEVNKKFEDVLCMSKEEFAEWAVNLRKTIGSLWDNKGQPPRVGYDEQEIIDQFNEMTSFPVHKFLVKDELTGEEDVIRNTSVVGNAVNQWFPTMMKTRINYTTDVNSGKSIYDYFAKDELLNTFTTYATRHFKRDSFYHYSTPIKLNQVIEIGSLNFRATSTNEFLQWFETKARAYNTHDYWLEPNAGDKEYTGYNEDLKDQTYLRITKDELLQLHASNPGLIPKNCTTNVDHKDAQLFRIRIYEKGQKLFPVGLKALKDIQTISKRKNKLISMTHHRVGVVDYWVLYLLMMNETFITSVRILIRIIVQKIIERSTMSLPTSLIQRHIVQMVCFQKHTHTKSFNMVQKKFITILSFKSTKVSWI